MERLIHSFGFGFLDNFHFSPSRFSVPFKDQRSKIKVSRPPAPLTMKRYLTRSIILCIVALHGASAFCTGAATPTTALSNKFAVPTKPLVAFTTGCRTTATGRNSIVLRNSAQDGTERGKPILALVLVGCLWMFTIPTEFRRAYICPDNPTCLENRAVCNNCWTTTEWKQGIQEYYSNGGGIVWDFSIEKK
jgi:hypothetical protein